MELFRLLGTIAIDNTEANQAIRDTTDTANNANDEVSSAFEKIGGAAGKIATGLAVAGAAIGGAFIAVIESTREYRKERGLLESAYTTAGHSTEAAKDTYSDLNAVMGDSGAEAVVPLERNTQWINKVSAQFEERLLGRNLPVDITKDLKEIISLLKLLLNRQIYLDSGALVGELSPLIDDELGYIGSRRLRGNI